jgi:hypothetical protein
MAICVAVLLGALASGCSSYQLRGTVVEGPTSAIAVVNKDDPRLGQPGVGGVVVSAVIDPQQLSRKSAGSTVSDANGQFALPIGELGAGLLEYEVQVVARSDQYQSAVSIFPLPGAGKRLLVILAVGREGQSAPRGDFLEETLKMGEPYMQP